MSLKYPATSFRCIKCGMCCRNDGRHLRRIVLTPLDADRVIQATSLSIEGFSRPSHNASFPFFRIMRKESGACVFLGNDSMCRIYDSRPIVCRCYPFPIEFDEQGVTFCPPSKHCPGLGRGEKLEREFFEKLAREVINNHRSCRKMQATAFSGVPLK